MVSIHEVKGNKAKLYIEELCAFIRSHDSTYEKNLEQAYRAIEIIDNLVRYAETIDKRINK